jgi:hypothetical protein
MLEENCPKCSESLRTREHNPGLEHSRQKISIHFCNSCAHIGLEIRGYLFSEHGHNGPAWHRAINDHINREDREDLAYLYFVGTCSNEDCKSDSGYGPTFHSELTPKGIEIHSIRCGHPDCGGVIKQFQNKLIPFTSDKEKYEEIEPNRNPYNEIDESQMLSKDNWATDVARKVARNVSFRSKSSDIPDDKHQREH